MAKVPQGIDQRQLTMVARRVLLDGLTALERHLDAITVVGAQAVYLRTPNAAVRNAPFTSDGDLSIDPLLLGDRPLLDETLRAAGFTLRKENEPGLWERSEVIGDQIVPVELDLLIPETLSPRNGRRSARVPPHGAMSARWIPGLEVAAVDHSPMRVTSLEPGDPREIVVNVAGPAALLVAKAFKIRDRLADAATRPDRLADKDAGDILRIMMTIPAGQVATTFAALREDPRVGYVAAQGVVLLRELFGRGSSPGVGMAVDALRGDVPEVRVRALARAFIAKAC
ncbi:hypothetical protein Ssi03_58080 [Sphaerisporangium siamense]|uniref:Nucleotidyltransferase family protein n=1 Tax=Sphaerisporangium siamense TaxID=795645 RepID=A0A7W7D7P5_9ACTN|nr:hypothetical protein [Sphaerisporangium siamense]MBB4700398.1 hypothetical protein [Sphaerisporangium siamense]GII87818.1 hypothetical protein Ssi03_58080 [Sphaerisporangium siamense]